MADRTLPLDEFFQKNERGIIDPRMIPEGCREPWSDDADPAYDEDDYAEGFQYGDE